MKTRLQIFLVLLTAALFLHLITPEPKRYSDIPQPLDIEHDEGEDHEGREAWFRFQHTGGADIEYEERHKTLRRTTADDRLIRQKRVIRSGRSLSRAENFGNGDLTGYWTERGAKNQAGRVIVTDMIDSKNRVILGTDGGSVMVGTLDAQEYEILNDQIQFNLKSVHGYILPSGGERIVAVDGGGIYVTDDNGATWDKTYTGSPISAIHSVATGKLYMVDWYGGIYESSDSGMTFNQLGDITNTSGKYEIWTPRYTSGDVYVIAFEEVHKWDGASLSKVGTIPHGGTFKKVAISGDVTGASSTLFAAIQHDNATSVYTSTNNGAGWTLISDAPAKMFMANSFYSASPTVLYCGNVECFRSTDGGSNWSKINNWSEYYEVYGGDSKTKLHADIPEIRTYKDSAGSLITLISTDGGTFRTYDHANYLNITQNGIRNSQYYGSQSRWENPEYILAGAQDQGIQHASAGQSSSIYDFYQFTSGDEGSFASSDSGKSAWFGYIYGSMYYCKNTQVASAKSAGKPDESDAFMWMTPTMADPDTAAICYVAGNMLHRVYYNGVSFEKSAVSSSFGSAITALAHSPVDKNHWYLSTAAKKFYHSSDRGKTWNEVASGIVGNHYLVGQGIVADPITLGTVYLCGNGSGNPSVFKSTNHGSTWTELGNSPTTTTYSLEITEDGKYLFAANNLAPYAYSFATGTWYNIQGNNAPDNRWYNLEYIPTINTIRYVTYGRGIWDFTLGEEVEPTPFVTLTAPNAGEHYNIGDTLNITWSTNLTDSIDIILKRAETTVKTVKRVSASSGKYSYVLDSVESGLNYSILLKDATSDTVSDASDKQIALTNFRHLAQSHISVESTDSEEPQQLASYTIDGNPDTKWHTEWSQSQPDFPHEIIYQLDTLIELGAYSYLPRQDGSNNGRVTTYEIQLSTDGATWKSVKSAILPDTEAETYQAFDTLMKVQWVRFIAKAEVDGDYFASMAEFNLWYNHEDGVSLINSEKVKNNVQLHAIHNGEITLAIPTAGTYNIRVLDMRGRELSSMNHSLETGMQRVPFTARALSAQVIILQVVGEGYQLTQKIQF